MKKKEKENIYDWIYENCANEKCIPLHQVT